MQFRPLPVLTACTLISLVILLYLGHWQYQRYEQKMAAGPESGPAPETVEFEVLAGPGLMAQQVYGLADSEPIWRRFVLAQRTDDQSRVLLAVNASGGPTPVHVQAACFDRLTLDVRIFEQPGRSSGRNQPDNNIWYVFDAAGMLERLGGAAGVSAIAEPAELIVYNADDLSREEGCARADPQSLERQRRTINPYGRPELVDPLPPQRHFGYAITWWGLAAALLGVYFVFHASRGRLSFRSGR